MKVEPRIQPVQFPERSEEDANIVQYFGFFRRAEIAEEAGRLLMLDLDFGRACSLRCPACFRRKNVVDDTRDADLTYEEILSLADEARGLGLREIKLCGAGEPTENPELLRLARDLTNRGIGLSIFTKGHVLGDDARAASVYRNDGIRSAADLARRLFSLKTSILVSCQSFDPQIQDRLVGNVPGHTMRRNRALETLAQVGFNKCRPTRLAICSNPITRDNYGQILHIYDYCRRRNILPITAFLMISGKQFDRAFLEAIDVTEEQKIELFVSVYRYNIEHGIQALEDIERDGVSAMPGIHPCNQIAAGLYVTSNGNVTSCPGDCTVIGNVKHEPLTAIWRRSRNYSRQGKYNCDCPFKEGRTLPRDYQSQVLDRLHEELSVGLGA